MLSAVEKFGPVPGPYAIPAHVDYQSTYAIAAGNSSAIPPSAELYATPSSLCHLGQLGGGVHALSTEVSRGYFTTAHPFTEYNHVDQRTRSAASVVSANSAYAFNLEQADKQPDVKLIMSINEFTRPHPKYQRQSTVTNSSPLLQQKTSGALRNCERKNGYISQAAPAHIIYDQDQSVPINLARPSQHTSGSNQSSQRLPATESKGSRPSSNSSSNSSSSVDIESDINMPPVSIPIQNCKPTDSALLQRGSNPNETASTTTAAAAAAYQLSYSHLYARSAGFFGAPVLYPSHPSALTPHTTASAMHPHASYLNVPHPSHATGLPHDTNAFSSSYLNAAVVASLFNAPQANQSALAINTESTTPAVAKNSDLTGSILALAPPSPGSALTASSASNLSQNTRYKNQPDYKNDVLLKAPPLQTANKLSSGTYLNDSRTNAPQPDTDADFFFKVPSGKEGSLKHRILTRPANSDKNETCKTSTMRAHNSTSNFKKGSYIELSNGVLRRVEDMRTEDFIQCAERSPQHQLTESTVVKISTTLPNTVQITFSYDKNFSKADIEVSLDHPFFVYGQGWASCSPDLSFNAFGLKCRRLQVGDICISLSKRELFSTNNNVPMPSMETSYKGSSKEAAPALSGPSCDGLPSGGMENVLSALTKNSLPNNLSMAQFPTAHTLPMHLLPSHLGAHHLYGDLSHMVTAYNTGAQMQRESLALPDNNIGHTVMHTLSPKMNSFYQPPQHLFHIGGHQTQCQGEHTGDLKKPQPRHAPHPLLSHNTPYYRADSEAAYRATSVGLEQDVKNSEVNNEDAGVQPSADEQSQPVDASLSRKRRWSAPESICDDAAEGQPPFSIQKLSADNGKASKNHGRTTASVSLTK